jgi:hypothetical protein
MAGEMCCGPYLPKARSVCARLPANSACGLAGGSKPRAPLGGAIGMQRPVRGARSSPNLPPSVLQPEELPERGTLAKEGLFIDAVRCLELTELTEQGLALVAGQLGLSVKTALRLNVLVGRSPARAFGARFDLLKHLQHTVEANGIFIMLLLATLQIGRSEGRAAVATWQSAAACTAGHRADRAAVGARGLGSHRRPAVVHRAVRRAGCGRPGLLSVSPAGPHRVVQRPPERVLGRFPRCASADRPVRGWRCDRVLYASEGFVLPTGAWRIGRHAATL